MVELCPVLGRMRPQFLRLFHFYFHVSDPLTQVDPSLKTILFSFWGAPSSSIHCTGFFINWKSHTVYIYWKFKLKVLEKKCLLLLWTVFFLLQFCSPPPPKCIPIDIGQQWSLTCDFFQCQRWFPAGRLLSTHLIVNVASYCSQLSAFDCFALGACQTREE